MAGVLVAPIGEEILFRGSPRPPGYAVAAWSAGSCWVPSFRLRPHHHRSGGTAGEAFQQAFVAFVARLPIALALGWLFVRRRTIWASFGLHAAFNGILLVVAEVARQRLRRRLR